jgi:intergrase/recombinase
VSSFQSALQSLDWDEYLRWLLANKHPHYGRNLWLLGKKTHHLAFSPNLILMEQTRRKEDVLKSISNLCRFLDIKHDTYFHEEFLRWLKRKEVKWKSQKSPYANYSISKTLTIDQVTKNIASLGKKHRIFCAFVLVSGLRTKEAVEAFNCHKDLCDGRVTEMFWSRRTKKANAVFCHPVLHKKITFTVPYNTLHRKLHSKTLGCQIRYLRKLNFTLVATNLDPLLAEFMQGRRGNISQRHYFLPMMNNYYKKWVRLWSPHISRMV